MTRRVVYRQTRDLSRDAIVALYRASGWSSAEKPEALHNALRGSSAVVSAWDGERLVGLGNAISDGFLVVYYPHLLVLPGYQRRGIGRAILEILQKKYRGFHQQILVADEKAVEFYKRCGFTTAGNTKAMWIYGGEEH